MQYFTKKMSMLVAGSFLLSGALLLSACQQPPQYWKMNPKKVSLPTDKQKDILSLLDQAGVTVVQQGRTLQMMLPTDLFFEKQSTNVKEDYVYTLHEIALYLHTYVKQFNPKPTIWVSGYTDTVFDSKDQEALSNQYAQAVAAYLWNSGFTSEQLRVKSYGSLNPIGDNRTAKGSSYNRRVMIQID